MMPFFLQHYCQFADRVVVWDEQSFDETREIIRSFPNTTILDWPYKGLDDERFIEAVNGWYKMARGQADWVMWPDIDEILYHPDPLEALSKADGDMVFAQGFAMISNNGMPQIGTKITDSHRTGIPQSNYDKWIIWRPEIDVQHTIGRHTYGNNWPRCSGKRATTPTFRLLHYHYFGVQYTKHRNQRNYARAQNKRFAWNYAAGHNDDPFQNGSVAWVQRAIEQGTARDVVA